MHSHLHGHPSLIQAVRKLEQMNPDKFELYFIRKTSTKIDSKNQEVDSLTRSEDVGLSVRIIKDQKPGFSYTTSMQTDAIDRAVQTAAEVATMMPADDYVDLLSFASHHYPNVDAWDSKGLSVPIDQKIALALQVEAECRRADKRVVGVRSATLTETAYEIHMVDSNGEHIQNQSTLYTASVTCKSEANGDSQIGSEFGFSNFLENINPSEVGSLAARWATELLGAGSAPTMKCPAIIRNSVVAELLEFLSASFSAEEIDKGRSMLAGKHGERVFSDQVSILNDGLLPGGYGTSPFDGEGVPSAKVALVNGGFLTGALYDTYYAKKMGETATGSSARSIKSPPAISVSNLYLQAGKKSADQLIEGVTKGILLTDLMGVHTANPITGDFSLGASGILIENGKLTRPVRGFAVAGNIMELFRKVTDVGNDLRFFGPVGSPCVRISEISVGGT